MPAVAVGPIPLSVHMEVIPVMLGAAFTHLPEKLIRRHKERILPKSAADDNCRVDPEHIYDNVAFELGQIVDANDGISRVVDQVKSSLVLNRIADALPIFQSPLHVGNQAGASVPFLAGCAKNLLP